MTERVGKDAPFLVSMPLCPPEKRNFLILKNFSSAMAPSHFPTPKHKSEITNPQTSSLIPPLAIISCAPVISALSNRPAAGFTKWANKGRALGLGVVVWVFRLKSDGRRRSKENLGRGEILNKRFHAFRGVQQRPDQERRACWASPFRSCRSLSQQFSRWLCKSASIF
jgi:hypothetical protein